jgi:hypothetical protein
VLGAGFGIFGGSYAWQVFAVGVTASMNDGMSVDALYYVPLAGPFILFARSPEELPYLLLGAGQLTGAFLVVIGFAARETILVRNDVGFRLAPVLGPRASGLAVLGRF